MTAGVNPQADESAWQLLPKVRTWGPARLTLTLATTAATKPQFGSRGWVVPAALQAVSIIGWNSLPMARRWCPL